MQTAVGLAFAKEFENKYGDFIQKCLLAGGNENGVSDILFSVGIMSGKGYVSNSYRLRLIVLRSAFGTSSITRLQGFSPLQPTTTGSRFRSALCP